MNKEQKAIIANPQRVETVFSAERLPTKMHHDLIHSWSAACVIDLSPGTGHMLEACLDSRTPALAFGLSEQHFEWQSYDDQGWARQQHRGAPTCHLRIVKLLERNPLQQLHDATGKGKRKGKEKGNKGKAPLPLFPFSLPLRLPKKLKKPKKKKIKDEEEDDDEW